MNVHTLALSPTTFFPISRTRSPAIDRLPFSFRSKVPLRHNPIPAYPVPFRSANLPSRCTTSLDLLISRFGGRRSLCVLPGSEQLRTGPRRPWHPATCGVPSVSHQGGCYMTRPRLFSSACPAERVVPGGGEVGARHWCRRSYARACVRARWSL